MEIRNRRKLELKERKNYLPTLVITIGLWLSIAFFILLVNPNEVWAIPTFLLLVFSTVTFTAAVLLGNTRRGVLLAIAVTLILGLRIINMASPLNIILLVSSLIAFEVYYVKM